jgi:opacity protein-like surface antigen
MNKLKSLSYALAFLLGAAAGRTQTLQMDASILHAFHGWDTTGFSADIGESFGNKQFLGFEFTEFNPSFGASYPGYPNASVSERIDTFQAAYRIAFPLGNIGGDHGYSPMEVYFGAAAGLGFVRQSLTYPSSIAGGPPSQASEQEAELCAELTAGLQYNFGPSFGIRAGFRYIDSINNVNLFNAAANTDTKTLEFGAVFRY